MRGLVRLIAIVAGLVVAAFGVLLVIEVMAAWLRPASTGLLVPWQRSRSALSAVSWNQLPVLIAAVIAMVIGLVLVLVSALAGRKEIRLHDPAPGVTVTTDPRSLARLVGHQVRRDDGVAAASVTATRQRVRVKAVGKFSSVGDLRTRVSESAEHTVQELPLRSDPRVSVAVSPAKENR